jgi:hypothetical protein
MVKYELIEERLSGAKNVAIAAASVKIENPVINPLTRKVNSPRIRLTMNHTAAIIIKSIENVRLCEVEI